MNNNKQFQAAPAVAADGLTQGQPLMAPCEGGPIFPDSCTDCRREGGLCEMMTSRATVVAPTVPAGYVLVPVEPTFEMIRAADDKGASLRDDAFRAVYKSMLTAAPAAQSQPAGAPTKSPHGYVNFETLDYVVAFGNDEVPEGYFPVTILVAEQAAQPAGAGAPSIDTPEFQSILKAYRNSTTDFAETKAALIAHIDAQLARQGAAPAQAEPVGRLNYERVNGDWEGIIHLDADDPRLVDGASLYLATAPAPAGVAQAVQALPLHFMDEVENGGYYLASDVLRILAIQASANNTGSEG